MIFPGILRVIPRKGNFILPNSKFLCVLFSSCCFCLMFFCVWHNFWCAKKIYLCKHTVAIFGYVVSLGYPKICINGTKHNSIELRSVSSTYLETNKSLHLARTSSSKSMVLFLVIEITRFKSANSVPSWLIDPGQMMMGKSTKIPSDELIWQVKFSSQNLKNPRKGLLTMVP